ncbi:MAG: hypothetical protein DWQ34_07925 [Planctomycetota bacterium]|nr:MAG: hypothetical protein DWQ29_13830 [Planctomycetota bacterium]REJ94657.1 MAG: hypothetical protein DWQ34_07925 [Planctomycetota bacterium]REK31383.1 MAG: hypothetical protein DWQ41_00615 [Planctomycetota bacterium]REK39106.1 MAG: hypothetical protein DWQ45_02650 [Planctomycetota bacterium]
MDASGEWNGPRMTRVWRMFADLGGTGRTHPRADAARLAGQALFAGVIIGLEFARGGVSRHAHSPGDTSHTVGDEVR